MKKLNARLLIGTWLIGATSFAMLAQAGATQMTTIRVASGLSTPIFVTSPPGDFDRLFIVEKPGRIKILMGGVVLPTPFLSITGLVSNGSEQGLLGLAFHPNYANNGFFYVNYTNTSGHTVVARYRVSAGNPNVADQMSATQVLFVSQPFTNHNGGMIAIGPNDGYLYLGMGDGGAGDDPGNRAQNGGQLLGKMLRIDVDGGSPYGIPPSNPFRTPGDGILDEIWAFGMRNPWRWSFDRLTGDLWIGDVGQVTREEIDFQPASSTGGENYGWKCMEGTLCRASNCACPVGFANVLPVKEYNTHVEGSAVTGGYVYRGTAMPAMQGIYFYSDSSSARIWSFRYNGSVTEFTERTAELDPPGGLSINAVYSFGEDAYGEMYVVDGGGEIFKIVPATAVSPDCNGNGVPDASDITFGASSDFDGNGVPDECGNVNSGAGPIENVLRINGASGVRGVVGVPVNAPVVVTLAPASSGPNPGDYDVWVWRTTLRSPRNLVVNAQTLGVVSLPTPFEPADVPQAIRCLRGGLGPEFCGSIRPYGSAPASTPWTLSRPTGFATRQTYVLQGVVRDNSAGNPSGLSMTNAVTLKIL